MHVTIIADASFDQRYSLAGYGYWIACARGKVPGGGLIRGEVYSATEAEMKAVCRALYDAVKLRLVEPGDNILIQTDCQGAIDSFQKSMVSPKSAAEEGLRPVWKVFSELCLKHNLRITFRHVKGHTNNPEARFATNRACDARAKLAMRTEREKRKMPEPKVAWLKGATK